MPAAKVQKWWHFALRHIVLEHHLSPPPGARHHLIPLHMQNPITLPRPTAGRILIHADPNHITIICAWSVQIPRAQMLEYLRTVDANANAGFFTSSEESLAFAHGAARISFSAQEFTVIRQFVEQVYGPN